MDISSNSGAFAFPQPAAPTSPPSTPESASSSQFRSTEPTATQGLGAAHRPNLGPAAKHIHRQLSYTPSCSDSDSDDSADEDDLPANERDYDYTHEGDNELSHSDSDDSDSDDESTSEAPPIPLSARRRSRALHITSLVIAEFTLNEITPDDIGLSDMEVIHPSQCEDAPSGSDLDAYLTSSSSSSSEDEEGDLLADQLAGLKCGPSREQRKQEREFERAGQARYRSRQKRWAKGANHKRRHGDTRASDESDEDVVKLDDDVVEPPVTPGRRLRRRTVGPEDTPARESFLETIGEVGELAAVVADGDQESGDEDFLLPPWMYASGSGATTISGGSSMDVDATRGSGAQSRRGRRGRR